MRIEHSRKHGPFDPRYPAIGHEPVPASLWRLGEERLDWRSFVARFFADSSRHDSVPIVAYESYMDDRARPNMRHGDAGEEPPTTADTERWEGEGGASAAPRRRIRRRE